MNQNYRNSNRRYDIEDNNERKIVNKENHITFHDSSRITPWVLFSWSVTCCFPPFILSLFGMKNKQVQQAWREKISLVLIIILLCMFVGLITFGTQQILCGNTLKLLHHGELSNNQIIIHGKIYDISKFVHPSIKVYMNNKNQLDESGQFKLNDVPFPNVAKKDLSFLFQKVTRNKNGICKNILVTKASSTDESLLPEDSGSDFRYFPCTPIDIFNKGSVQGSITSNQCHQNINYKKLNEIIKPIADIYYKWSDIKNKKDNKLIVFNGSVLDLSRLSLLVGDVDMSQVVADLSNPSLPYLGQDVSIFLSNRYPKVASCLMDLIRVGRLDTKTIGCLATDVILYISLFIIIGVLLTKFLMAVIFGWVISWRLGRLNEKSLYDKLKRMDEMEEWAEDSVITHQNSFIKNNNSFLNKSNYSGSKISINNNSYKNGLDFSISHTILLVTCYSEDKKGIKTTLDSLANTKYPNTHKLLFVVCDGIITGAGNTTSTPDVCLSLMSDLLIPKEDVKAYSYIAVADGEKRHNMAKVYAGYYYTNTNNKNNNNVTTNNRVPMVLVVKCGTRKEASTTKPGNRGKRDSQLILMSFLQKSIMNDRMTELEYELFNAIWNVSKVTPDIYETVLMVDADTSVYRDSLMRMIACFSRDSNIMGLCGETKIANKSQSWVTMIQVFEYYISHHMSKAFESVFGGVTCLPGCFCMYRIKAPKYNEKNQLIWVPILVTPDIIDQYSESQVHTLHSKNLLLLGEGRFLTTLMLRTFPKRKLVFVPQAVCKTIVPDEFSVLLSQRRRWINSTVHNLLELVITRDLCGTFCFSMQFMVFMELIGTIVLPAAIIFTFYLITMAIIQTNNNKPILPLILLILILGLPAILILMTTRKLIYVVWMLIYLLSIPIWNFVLPVYAFWHFDDFSWGATRQLAESNNLSINDQNDNTNQDEKAKIVMKKWAEFEKEKRLITITTLSKHDLNKLDSYSKIRTNNYLNIDLGNDFKSNEAISELIKLGYISPPALKKLHNSIKNRASPATKSSPLSTTITEKRRSKHTKSIIKNSNRNNNTEKSNNNPACLWRSDNNNESSRRQSRR